MVRTRARAPGICACATSLSPSGGDTALCQPRAASRSMSPRWGLRPREQREFRWHRGSWGSRPRLYDNAAPRLRRRAPSAPLKYIFSRNSAGRSCQVGLTYSSPNFHLARARRRPSRHQRSARTEARPRPSRHWHSARTEASPSRNHAKPFRLASSARSGSFYEVPHSMNAWSVER
jgi:hypothetical protein